MEKDVLVLQYICIFIVEIAGEGECLGLKGYLKRARIQHPTSHPVGDCSTHWKNFPR